MIIPLSLSLYTYIYIYVYAYKDVKRAYRLLALLHHPDKGGDLETFRLVQRAYEEEHVLFIII